MWYLFCFKVPNAEKDPVLMALKGRAYLNKGQVDQALKVKKPFWTLSVNMPLLLYDCRKSGSVICLFDCVTNFQNQALDDDYNKSLR